jgi:hypothetical protein
MSRICDRSPCDTLLRALGIWIFGSSEGFYIVAVNHREADTEVDVDYCPFCGTRLEEVGTMAIEKYLRPRKRRRATKVGTA